jgi:hypothetical protein
VVGEGVELKAQESGALRRLSSTSGGDQCVCAAAGTVKARVLRSRSTMRLSELQANQAERNRVSTRHQMITGGSYG